MHDKSVLMNFRVLPHERDLIRACAVHAGLTTSQFLREMLKHLPTPDGTPLSVRQHSGNPCDNLPPNICLTATVPKPPTTPKPVLCPRCQRIGAPSCPACNS